MQKQNLHFLSQDMRGPSLCEPYSRSSSSLNIERKITPRVPSLKRQHRNTWHYSSGDEQRDMAKMCDKEAWDDTTLPEAQPKCKLQPNAKSRIEIQKLKNIFPIKVLKQLVEECELRDYRARAEKLIPKGDYYGMKNFHRSASVSSYFAKGLLYSYPAKTRMPSLHELVLEEDDDTEDDVFSPCGLTSSCSEPSLFTCYEEGLNNLKLDKSNRPIKSIEKLHKWPSVSVSLENLSFVDNYCTGDQPLRSATERLHGLSAGKLREREGLSTKQGHQPPLQGQFNRREHLEIDKPISNLSNTCFNGCQYPDTKRPVLSASAVQQQHIPSNSIDYHARSYSLNDSKSYDYKIDPFDNRMKNPVDQNRGYPYATQTSLNIQLNRPLVQQHIVAPKPLQSFNKPQVRHFGQDHLDFPICNPRSEEMNVEKPCNWHDIQIDHTSSWDSVENRASNYNYSHAQPNYANQGEIRKMDMDNHPKQLQFYGNKMSQQETVLPNQHFKQPSNETEKGRIQDDCLPARRNQPLVQLAEMPRSDVDKRQTQSYFRNLTMSDSSLYTSNGYRASSGSQSNYQNTSFHDDHAEFRPKTLHEQNLYMNKNMNILPVSPEIPPDVPPPPSMDDDDNAPPLPPPPLIDYRLEQLIREEESRIFQSTVPSYSNISPQNSRNHSRLGIMENSSFSINQSLQPKSSGNKPLSESAYQPKSSGNKPLSESAYQPKSSGNKPLSESAYQPQYSVSLLSQKPQTMPAQTAGNQQRNDYQNMSYANRSLDNIQQNQATYFQKQPNYLYKSHDQNQQPAYPNKFTIPTPPKDKRDIIVSPWQREEQEKLQKQYEKEMYRICEMEIAELESCQQRMPQEEERLGKLKLEQEFQRRLQEVESKDDDDSDDDRFIGSRISMQTIQEDLIKSRLLMKELELKRQYQDMEKEKDRMQRLERRLEMFEREREDQRIRKQLQLEKEQKEHEEYLRKQKEAREKQKWQIEENLRLQKIEDEKMRERQRIVEEKRKEMEHKRQKEIQSQKEAEEARAREQIRRQEEEYQRQQRAEQEKRRIEEKREIRVAEECKRLEARTYQQQLKNSYQ